MNCFVKESHSVIWHFYHNSQGICYCKMKDENLGKYQVLIEDATEDFDVIADDDNCIHMVYQNTEGDILYANHIQGKWRKSTLMQSKSRGYYNKKIRLFKINNRLYMLYCIGHNGKNMLVHQTIGAQNPPMVLDCIVGEYCVAMDSEENLILLFNSTEKGWGKRLFDFAKDLWCDFSPVSLPLEASDVFLYVDLNDNEHILYEKSGGIYELYNDNHRVLGNGRRPVMLHHHCDMILWEGLYDNKIYIKKKGDTAPTVIMSGGFSRPLLFGIRYTSSEEDLRGDFCTGNITNGGVSLYGVREFFKVSAPVVETDTVSESMEIKKLKILVNQLNVAIERLEKRVDAFEKK